MTKPTMWIKNVGYLDCADVRIWASMSYWRYQEAILLSMNICPQKGGEENSESKALELGEEFMLKMEMVDRAVHFGDLDFVKTPCVDEGPDGPEDSSEISYVPHVYVKWAIDRIPSFPIRLYKAIKVKYPDEFAGIADPLETTLEKSEQFFRPDQKAKERCRAIAEMLWDKDPSIKTKDMIVHPAIKKYGAGMYVPKTIYGWIKDLAPKNRDTCNSIAEFED